MKISFVAVVCMAVAAGAIRLDCKPESKAQADVEAGFLDFLKEKVCDKIPAPRPPVIIAAPPAPVAAAPAPPTKDRLATSKAGQKIIANADLAAGMIKQKALDEIAKVK